MIKKCVFWFLMISVFGVVLYFSVAKNVFYALQEEERLWCKEHNVYEDECNICHPELKEKKNGKVATEELQCDEHKLPEMECGICQPQLVNNLTPGKGMKVRLISNQSSRKLNIKTTKPKLKQAGWEISCLCIVRYNKNNYVKVTPLISGIIKSVNVDFGTEVKRGDVLAEMISQEIHKACSEYVTTLSDEAHKKFIFEREKFLNENKATTQYEFRRAEVEYNLTKTATVLARQQLLNLGFSNQEIAEIEKVNLSEIKFKLYAPISGTVIQKEAVTGEYIEEGKNVLTVADLNTMWLEITLPADKISMVELKSEVEAHFDFLPGETFKGNIDWISTSIDEHSKTLKMRAILENRNNILRDGMFGKAKIKLPVTREVFSVPIDALQTLDSKKFVFVKISEDLFEFRNISTGGKNGNEVEILSGLKSDDDVVISHSFTLKSELLKSKLGAGCVGD